MLSEKEKQESIEEEKIIKLALQQQRFLIDFARACFIKKDADFEGVWQMPDGKLIQIYVNDKKIISTSEGNHFKTKFEGSLYNSSAIVKNYKTDFISSGNKEPIFKDDGKGYIFFSSEGTLNIMNIKENKPFFTTCVRYMSHEKGEEINNTAIS